MNPDDPRIPPPPRTLETEGPHTSVGGAPGAPHDEEVEDEATWAAAGGPWMSREETAEVSYYEDSETHIDWNGPSSPLGGHAPEDTLNFGVRPALPAGDGAPTDYPSEPGYPDDGGSLSALRDAMRGGARRPGPAPLPIPPPRARAQAEASLPPIGSPPVRRVGPPSVEPPGAAGRSRRPARRQPAAGWIAPVLAGVVALAFGGFLVLRGAEGPPPEVVEPPMLPVVGGPAPKTMPAPPFDLPGPQEYRPDLLADLSIAPEELPARILQAQAAGDHHLAASLADRLVRAERRPALFFDLAVLLSEVGERDAALYWLVRAIQEHGVPPEWLVQRRAFRYLWGDPRWNDLAHWATLARRHHAEREPNPATIVLPTSLEDAAALDGARRPGGSRRARGAPTLPVVLWLDDVGGNGSTVLGWGQELADELGVIVLGIGGPERIGPAGSWWTSDPERDREHVANALAAIPGAVPDPSRRYLVGVGQGGQYAVELLLREPTFARAALALAPSDDWRGPRDKLGEGQRDRDQHALLLAGALTPETHTLIRLYDGRLKRAGVQASMKLDAAPWPWPEHLPEDAPSRVRAWVADLLSPPDPDAEAASLPAAGAGELAERTPDAP